MPTQNRNPAQPILAYLRERLPRYPFKESIDEEFVGELADDFPSIEILSEIKTFRWFYDNDPVGRLGNVRVAIRRWIENATARRRGVPRRASPATQRASRPTT